MDQLLTSAFWHTQLGVVMSAPWLIIPLLIAAAIISWWLRGAVEGGRVEGLREQLKARDERLQLAREKEADVGEKLEVAKAEGVALKEQVSLFVGTDPKFITIQSSVGSTVDAIERANTSSKALHSTLTAVSLSVGPPEFLSSGQSENTERKKPKPR
jgi:hypothetical protein